KARCCIGTYRISKDCENLPESPVPTLQAWLAFGAADSASPFLSNAFVDVSFDMYDQTISGASNQMDRWKRGVYTAGGGIDASDSEGFRTIRWAVGELYVRGF